MSGNKAEGDILWDAKFADGAKAKPGEYFITLKISDAAGNERMMTTVVDVTLFNALIPLPAFEPPTSAPEPVITPRAEYAPSTFGGETVIPGEPPAPSTVAGGGTQAEGKPVITQTTSKAPVTSAFPIPTSAILWGAASAAAVGYFAAEAQKRKEEEEQKEREEAEARQDALAQMFAYREPEPEPKVPPRKNKPLTPQERLQAIWDRNGAMIYEMNQQFKVKYGKEMDSATKKKAIKDATQNGVFQAEKYAENLNAAKRQQEARNQAIAAKLARMEAEEERQEQARLAAEEARRNAQQKAMEDFRRAERGTSAAEAWLAEQKARQNAVDAARWAGLASVAQGKQEEEKNISGKPLAMPAREDDPPTWWEKITNAVGQAWDVTKTTTISAWNLTKTIATDFGNLVVETGKSLAYSFNQTVVPKLNSVFVSAQKALSSAWDDTKNVFIGIKNDIASIPFAIKDAAKENIPIAAEWLYQNRTVPIVTFAEKHPLGTKLVTQILNLGIDAEKEKMRPFTDANPESMTWTDLGKVWLYSYPEKSFPILQKICHCEERSSLLSR